MTAPMRDTSASLLESIAESFCDSDTEYLAKVAANVAALPPFEHDATLDAPMAIELGSAPSQKRVPGSAAPSDGSATRPDAAELYYQLVRAQATLGVAQTWMRGDKEFAERARREFDDAKRAYEDACR